MAFSLFPNLPLELRIQIWHYALPEKKESSLVPYRKGCWKVLPPTSDESKELPLVFQHHLLDKIQIKIPLAFVNHEARNVALSWIHKQDIKVRFSNNTQPYILTREFDPLSDALYVPFDKIFDFLNEHWQITRGLRLGVQGYHYSVQPKLTNIAIPEALLHDADIIDEMFENFFDPKVLFIIVDTHPDFEDNSMKVQQQWNLESFQGMSVSWDYEQRKFEWKTGSVIGGDALHKRIKEAIEDLDQTMIEDGIKSFEIRPVFAVKESTGLSGCIQQEK